MADASNAWIWTLIEHKIGDFGYHCYDCNSLHNGIISDQSAILPRDAVQLCTPKGVLATANLLSLA